MTHNHELDLRPLRCTPHFNSLLNGERSGFSFFALAYGVALDPPMGGRGTVIPP
jgi:hypothetical protein